jgi:hypothetical protein
MTTPLNISAEQLNAILNNSRETTPLHTVLDDRRMKPFMTPEEFETKWNIQPQNKPSLTTDNTYMKEDGAPSPALVSPDGNIKGAPKPQEVKKMRTRLNQEK